MAKRFIETSFFKDPFVRGLQGAYKGLYIYLFLDCSNAGIWNVELDVARLRCDIPETCTDEDIKKAFSEKIMELENGEKWLLKNFLKVQHNGILKRNNKAHTGAINELSKHGLLEETEEGIFSLKDIKKEGASKGLTRPTGIGKGNGKGKSNGKGIGKSEKAKKENLVLPFESDEFKKQWELWKEYKSVEHKFDYKTTQSEQAALTELNNKSKQNQETAIAIIHQSMANGWKGFFNLKNDSNGKENRNSKTNTEIARSAMDSEVGRNYRTQ